MKLKRKENLKERTEEKKGGKVEKSLKVTHSQSKKKTEKSTTTIWFCSFGCVKQKDCKHKTLFYSTLVNKTKKPLYSLISSIHPSILSSHQILQLQLPLPHTSLSSSSLLFHFSSSSPSSLSFLTVNQYERLSCFTK
jgi:hypothetical protein